MKKLKILRQIPSPSVQKKSFGPESSLPIRVGDEKFDLILNIMVGIKKSISCLADIYSMVPLSKKQFKLKLKTENQWISNFDTDAKVKYQSFKFRDYAPLVF